MLKRVLPTLTPALATTLTVATLTLAACGSGSATTGATSTSTATSSAGQSAAGNLTVVASFYPLQYAAQRVLGDRGTVTNLTKAGAEPHDLELKPQDVATVSKASLVVYLAGFQPSVDTAVRAQAADRSLDVTAAARLEPVAAHEGAHVGAAAEEEGHEESSSGTDPHFWLDPTRLADVGDALAARLAQVDPAGAATYTAGAAALRTDLLALDGELRTGLATCTSKNLVTSHEAFGYLAERYGLTQVGIAGLSPEAEPDARTLANVADFVKTNKVRTIYYETLVSPAIAETVARSTGAATAVLDPIEGLSDASAAQDYLGVMRANLAALRAGQPCT